MQQPRKVPDEILQVRGDSRRCKHTRHVPAADKLIFYPTVQGERSAIRHVLVLPIKALWSQLHDDAQTTLKVHYVGLQ